MAASTVPAAKQAVLTMLAAIPALNQAGITWGEPTEQEDLRDELIFFLPTDDRLPEWRELAANSPLRETYTLPMVIRNRFFGDDPASTEQRTWAIIALVEAAIRADLRLGGLLFVPIRFGEQEVRAHQLSDGWFGEASVPLVCTASI
jgi:hypothetical protein